MLTKLLGNAAERLAEKYLVRQGLIPICKNYHSKRGELDLVMRDGVYWVCIEVKYRKNASHGCALEMVTKHKLMKMKAAFEQFLLDNGLNPNTTPQRFDVVAINGENLNWLTNVTG